MNTIDYPSHLGKMPPLSIDIEKAVLSVLFNDSDKFISVESVLTTNCFYNTEHQILFDAIQSIHMDNAKINASSIIRKLYDLRNSDLMDVYRSIKSEYSSSDQLFRNATLLAEFATKRALIENSQKLLSMCFNDEPMDTIDALVGDGVNIATSRNRAIDGVKFIDSVEKMKIKMNRKLIDGLSGVTTGIKVLNNVTAGWQHDDIVIIAGRPGSGKTASATFHAYEAAKDGCPVAFISLEVEDESLTGRIVSNVSRTPSSLIAKAQLAPNVKAHVEAVADQLVNLPIYYYPVSESWDINDISLVLRNWARRYGIKKVVIDFLQLMTDRTVKGDNPVMVINSILNKIKKLRATLGIPFVIYSQLNRENEGKADKRPSLSGLKGSGAIEETGTVIIFLYREDYYNKAIAEAAGNDYINSDNLEYIFAKNRQGDTGTVNLKCNIAQNRIYEVETKPLVPDTQLELDTGK